MHCLCVDDMDRLFWVLQSSHHSSIKITKARGRLYTVQCKCRPMIV